MMPGMTSMSDTWSPKAGTGALKYDGLFRDLGTKRWQRFLPQPPAVTLASRLGNTGT